MEDRQDVSWRSQGQFSGSGLDAGDGGAWPPSVPPTVVQEGRAGSPQDREEKQPQRVVSLNTALQQPRWGSQRRERVGGRAGGRARVALGRGAAPGEARLLVEVSKLQQQLPGEVLGKGRVKLQGPRQAGAPRPPGRCSSGPCGDNRGLWGRGHSGPSGQPQ